MGYHMQLYQSKEEMMLISEAHKVTQGSQKHGHE